MLNLQNAARPMMEEIHHFHDILIMILLPIASSILLVIFMLIRRVMSHRILVDDQKVETYWTFMPCVILLVIALPSLRLLYLYDAHNEPALCVKALGHQWYWQYDYPSLPSYNSYLRRDYRLLRRDNHLILPLGVGEVLVSAADVLHSWTVPSIAVKADAVPGRVNKLTLRLKRPGMFFGQCSEICGRNHRFMPITLESYIFSLTAALKVV